MQRGLIIVTVDPVNLTVHQKFATIIKGIFENPIKKENFDLWQTSHLTEDMIVKYNSNKGE